jgi:SAM-dependent methyltransferase
MTAEMITKARANAQRIDAQNVEFRLGEIEHLPVADATVDVIVSNCVINLSPDKPAVFSEAYRVLLPGGRLAIADIVATSPIPRELAEKVAALTGCIAGAILQSEFESMLEAIGFENVRITVNEDSRTFFRDWMPDLDAGQYVASATIEASKPSGNDKRRFDANSNGATA